MYCACAVVNTFRAQDCNTAQLILLSSQYKILHPILIRLDVRTQSRHMLETCRKEEAIATDKLPSSIAIRSKKARRYSTFDDTDCISRLCVFRYGRKLAVSQQTNFAKLKSLIEVLHFFPKVDRSALVGMR